MSELHPGIDNHNFGRGALDDRASRSPQDHARDSASPAGRTTSFSSNASYQQLLTEARIEFDAWWIECVRAAIHKRPHCQITARCHCGKRVKGLGLCANHLSQEYRRRTGKISGKHVRDRRPSCHPDHARRKHKAFGLCAECYESTRVIENRSASAASKYRRRFADATRVTVRSRSPRNAWKCKHPDRPHKARGLCRTCYSVWQATIGSGRRPRMVRYSTGIPLKCGCAYAGYANRGMCRKHYSRWWRRTHRANRAAA